MEELAGGVLKKFLFQIIIILFAFIYLIGNKESGIIQEEMLYENQEEIILTQGVPSILNWTKANEVIRIYDSSIDDWDYNFFKRRFNTYPKISIVVFTNDNDVFGFYTKKTDCFIAESFCDSTESFIFSLKTNSSNLIPRTYFPQRFWKNSILFSSNKQFLFSTGAFTIELDNHWKTSFIDPFITSHYPSLLPVHLIGNNTSNYFQTKRIVMFHSI